MTCFNPLVAWQHKTRKSNTGKSMVVVGAAPPHINEWTQVQVPCGQCLGCRLERARTWAIRCMHENQMHDVSCFLTLTYDEDHVPWSQSGEQTLNKRDLQLFWKRLRKETGCKIRYFACGEYGDNTGRPHYHAICYGYWPKDAVLYGVSGLDDEYYISSTLNKIWQNGNIIVGRVSYDSCCYVARYVVKKFTGVAGDNYYGDCVKPYVVMSRRPGIGRGWYDKYRSDVYPYDEAVCESRGRVRRGRPPRYYDNLLQSDDVDMYEDVKKRRLERITERVQLENATAGRLDARRKFKEAQTKSVRERSF